MMVTFVSQCEKKALKKTRRVLDAFANRIGDNIWQTVITQEGLLAVNKLLRKTATKNTAVSCHWIRSRARSELNWVVGNRNKFNLEGMVPVNRTSLNINHREWEHGWHLGEVIAIASGIGGLFHDFGKANALFQLKLKGQTKHKGEPYRHEWVSLRLFESFTNDRKDEEWLTELSQLTAPLAIEERVLASLYRDNPDEQKRALVGLAPFAKLIAWLIVTHHRLPMDYNRKADIGQMDKWLSNCFDSSWNSANALKSNKYTNEDLEKNWQFEFGTPFLSSSWRTQARKIAARALQSPLLLSPDESWFEQNFVSHLSRLSLILADHYYSSLPANKSKKDWRDSNYEVMANTVKANTAREKKVPKQQLDEHNIGVCRHARRIAEGLSDLKDTLPAIAKNKQFEKPTNNQKYIWQNEAFRKIKAVATSSKTQGFFGIDMASTGCGKTLANARIMYGLANGSEGCRFSVALGLRTLTLQTGDAFRKLLDLTDKELAVLIGSQEVNVLHSLNDKQEKESTGSESADDLLDNLHVSYQGQIHDHRLKHWLDGKTKLEQLICAPVLVSTIDHLIPATEGIRGGQQIAPMLRLLTSDLVLDEPDDFGLEDLPALCRLINWAGMLGSRVLLSSATLPPALVKVLFDAYICGRQQFAQAQHGRSTLGPVVCAWIDEFKTDVKEVENKTDFLSSHTKFVKERVDNLDNNEQQQGLRKGHIVPLEEEQEPTINLYQQVARVFNRHIHQLHNEHKTISPCGKKVSFGVVRMANINPLVAIAKELQAIAPDAGYHIYYCVYHSQFPLALRSYKESRLDSILDRNEPESIWEEKEIQEALRYSKSESLIFVVLGTAVVEVGRDHDYDWAIAEPSSMRSLIQLAGRIQRHRCKAPATANIHVLNQNIRALKGESPAYCKPGFESKALPLISHELQWLLTDELNNITAKERIVEPEFTKKDFKLNPEKENKQAYPAANMRVQEHRALRFCLAKTQSKEYDETFYRNNKEANLWWQPTDTNHARWNAEFIRQTEFRRSQRQEAFVLRRNDDDLLVWSQFDTTGKDSCYVKMSSRFKDFTCHQESGCSWWIGQTTLETYKHYASALDWKIEKASELLGKINLRIQSDDGEITWDWHEQLGVYEPITIKASLWK